MRSLGLAAHANRLAGRSIVLGKFVYEIADASRLGDGVFRAAY
jgi:hypothetical protein